MKIKKTVFGALLLCAAACVVFSCGGFDPASYGSEIRFSGRTSLSYLKSKTDYTGVTDGTGTVTERIEWSNGDKITIVSPDAKVHDKSTTPWTFGHSEGSYSRAVYRVGNRGVETVATDTADVTSVENGLQWHDPGTYRFFAMYPDSSSFDTAADRNRVSLTMNTSLSENAANCKAFIPKEQNYTAVRTTQDQDTTIVRPDMRYAYMYASASAIAASITSYPPVSLNFYPMVTTFQFTVNANPGSEVALDHFTLSSKTCSLNGDFTAAVALNSNPPTYVIPSYSAGQTDTVRLWLPRENGVPTVKVTDTTYAVITLFVLPEGKKYSDNRANATTITDLEITFYTVADGRKRAHRLQLMPKDVNNLNNGITLSSNNYVEFPAGKKVNIKGLTLPSQIQPWSFTVSANDLLLELSDVAIIPVDIQEWEYEPVDPVLDETNQGTTNDYNTDVTRDFR